MMSSHYYLLSLLIISILRGVSCEELSPVKNEEYSLEDKTVTLTYQYSKQSTGTDTFFWYRQYPGKPPELIISHSAKGTLLLNPVSGLNIEVELNQIKMNISSVTVTHSAVYYCAVQLNVGAQKLTFGRGIRLKVESIKEYQPSYYKLSENDTTACLATGFSRDKATKEFEIFNKTEAVRIDGDSLYNEVSLIKGNEECPISEESGSCQESLKPDETVNLAGLTILGLRLIFFKTVIFNVLMTLRLWLSH